VAVGSTGRALGEVALPVLPLLFSNEEFSSFFYEKKHFRRRKKSEKKKS
jgi:hypothetical protein